VQESFADYRVGVEQAGEYRIVLNSDRKEFGGHERIDENTKFFTTPMGWNNRANFMQVYSKHKPFRMLGGETVTDCCFTVPCRTAIVRGFHA